MKRFLPVFLLLFFILPALGFSQGKGMAVGIKIGEPMSVDFPKLGYLEEVRK